MAKDYSVGIGTPMRDKNEVKYLINGEDAWKMVYDEIEKAEATVHLCFWALESDHELIRLPADAMADPSRRNKYTIYKLLERKKAAGVKIRVLLWDFPANARQDFADTLMRLSGKSGIFEVLYQSHPSIIGSWHQKTIIIDDNRAFVAGMNAKGNDWDTSSHDALEIRRAKFKLDSADRRKIVAAKDHKATNPPRHDYMTFIRGNCVADVQANFVERWNYCIDSKLDYFKYATKINPPQPTPDQGTMKAQIVRTMPQYPGCPSGEKGILASYIKAVQQAEKYIYIEDQYFRSKQLADEIAAAAKKNPKLKVIIATPPNYLSGLEPNEWFKIAAPSTYWTAESYDIIAAAIPGFILFYFQSSYLDTGGKRVFVPIDLHAKIMIIDDDWYTIGSCNINERGFLTEGEINISVPDASAADLRKKVFSCHLNEPCPDDIDQAIKLWFEHARFNQNAWTSGSMPKSFIYPFAQKGPLLPVVPRTWF